MGFSKLLFSALSSLVFISMFSACENKKTTDLTVHWDRDMCSRCVMVISDRHNTVQIINPKTKKKYVFDDIGCMAVWFKKEDVVWKDKANIWINDAKTGKWIDARSAFYDVGNITPMGYGFSAHKSKSDTKGTQDSLGFNDVMKRILNGEE